MNGFLFCTKTIRFESLKLIKGSVKRYAAWLQGVFRRGCYVFDIYCLEYTTVDTVVIIQCKVVSKSALHTDYCSFETADATRSITYFQFQINYTVPDIEMIQIQLQLHIQTRRQPKVHFYSGLPIL